MIGNQELQIRGPGTGRLRLVGYSEVMTERHSPEDVIPQTGRVVVTIGLRFPGSDRTVNIEVTAGNRTRADSGYGSWSTGG